MAVTAVTTCSRHSAICFGAIPASCDALYAPCSSSITLIANIASPFSSIGSSLSSLLIIAAVRSVGALMPNATVLQSIACGVSPSMSSCGMTGGTARVTAGVTTGVTAGATLGVTVGVTLGVGITVGVTMGAMVRVAFG